MTRVSALRTEISELWHQVNRRMHGLLHEAFRESDLPAPFFVLLREIAREPGITVSELARRVDLVKSHVSRTVDHLVQRGYVRKQSDPEDQRLARLYILPEAHARLHRTGEAVRAAWDAVVAGVPDEELATVERGLRILLDTLERHSATRKRERD